MEYLVRLAKVRKSAPKYRPMATFFQKYGKYHSDKVLQQYTYNCWNGIRNDEQMLKKFEKLFLKKKKPSP